MAGRWWKRLHAVPSTGVLRCLCRWYNHKGLQMFYASWTQQEELWSHHLRGATASKVCQWMFGGTFCFVVVVVVVPVMFLGTFVSVDWDPQYFNLKISFTHVYCVNGSCNLKSTYVLYFPKMFFIETKLQTLLVQKSGYRINGGQERPDRTFRCFTRPSYGQWRV